MTSSETSQAHHFAVEVYYEDTDMAAIVYHANYLRFIERARSAFVAQLGLDQRALLEQGIAFAVARIEADFRKAAHFGDKLDVVSEIIGGSAARLHFSQKIYRDAALLFEAKVTVVAMGSNGKPRKLPAEIRALIEESAAQDN